MTELEPKFNSFQSNMVELITSESDYTDETFASISLNPMVSWAKFILTDDLPNANKQRVPKEEFTNLIKTGHFMPIKMALSKINDGHEDSIPLGVITHLKEVGNKIIGIAALWNRERPEDVDLLKKLFKEGNKPQLSWEIAYSESVIADDGVEELKDTALRAVTLVGMPAYSGRTAITALASQTEESSVEELEQLKSRVAELEKQLAEREQAIQDKDSELSSIKTELASLQEYKQTIETEKANASKLDGIKNKFKSAGIEKDEDYFVSNKDKFLSMDESSLEFMLQEMISFSNTSVASTKVKAPKVPNVQPVDVEDLKNPQNLGKLLRESREQPK